MERYTYFDGGKWRMRIGDTEYSGKAIDRLAAYEETGLEPVDFKRALNEDAVLKLAGQVLSVTPDRLRELAKADKEGQHIPAADVAEVVRCKDCVWRGREECAMFYCCDCGEQHTWETDNDFCSYGAPMTDEAVDMVMERLEALHETT